MVKFGKEFRTKQIEQYKNKYFNYKEYKQLIKSMINDLKVTNEIESKKNEFKNTFRTKINSDLKRIFIYFVKEERLLYKKINSHLYRRENYNDYQNKEYYAELYEIYEISNNSLNLSTYVYYNIKAIIKILKKFNKKIINNINIDFKYDYIANDLEGENSDLLYIYKFKIIDEVNILIEDLIKTLKKAFKFKKNLLGKITNSKDEKLNQNDEIYYQKFKDFYKRTKINIKLIDKISFNFTDLFKPWNIYLKNKDELTDKLMKIRNNSINSEEDRSFSNIIEQKSINKFCCSKNILINVICTYFHTFLYMFSYSVIIPNNYYYLTELDNYKDNAYLLYALIMVSVPIGTIISFSYETVCFKNSTKYSIIISLSLQILGNIMYIVEIQFEKHHMFYLLIISRVFIGLSAIRTTNKMYLANYLPKNNRKYYIIIFDICTMLGLGFGFLINIAFIELDIILKNNFNKGNIICTALSFFLLIFVIVFFKETKSDNILTKINEFDSISMETMSESELEKDSKMINDINQQLGNFNSQNKYDDTNLVSSSVIKNISSAKKGLKSLVKPFLVFSTTVFVSKFINEFFFIVTPLYSNDNEDGDNTQVNLKHLKNVCLLLGITCFIIPLIEIIFDKLSKKSTEKTIVYIVYITLLFLNVSKLVFIIIYEKNHSEIIKHPFFILAISFSIILSRFIEKASSLFFSNIFPNEFILCGMSGNMCINIISHIGRVIAAILPFLLHYFKFYTSNIIYYSIMLFFSLVSFIIFTIYYNDLRIKAISRVINQKKPKLEVTTEI
jgi:hypothetical protein